MAARPRHGVLSGRLNDGTAGLRATKRCGGRAVVQVSFEAAFPEMPTGVLRQTTVDTVAAAHEMAALLARLTPEPPGEMPEIPFDIRLETATAAQELIGMEADQQLGQPLLFACPEGHGAPWRPLGNRLRRTIALPLPRGACPYAEAVHVNWSRRTEELPWNLLPKHRDRTALVAGWQRKCNRCTTTIWRRCWGATPAAVRTTLR